MRRILHLSDLHFGRTRPELIEPLLTAVGRLAPDLVAVSGDLTQRARRSQFAEARAFLDRLPAPWLAIPGNHDVALDNIPVRLLVPWLRYRRAVCRRLEPVHEDAELLIVGVNTVDPLSWQRGRLSRRALARLTERLSHKGERMAVVVAHHPFQHRGGERKALMRGADRAVDALSRAGADILLTGHLHRWAVLEHATRLSPGGALQVQAGTGLSDRGRGEANDFNLLTIGRGSVEVARFVHADARGFSPAERLRFERGARGWQTLSPERARA